MIDEAHEDAIALKEDMKDLNTNMKDMLSKMREPGKLCLDIILLFIFSLLLGLAIYLGVVYFGSSKEKA